MEYEFTMSLMNLNMDPGIETVFLMAKEEFSHLSSSLVRQIATLGGDLSKFMPTEVNDALRQRAKERAEGNDTGPAIGSRD
jgi:pantetheine-phosphate adenylyltransferase